MKQKRIIFKLKEFPHLSETFIVAQIITAINLGYDVQILAKKVLDLKSSKFSNLVKEYGLLNKIIIENYELPKNKIIRLLKWCFIILKNLFKLKAIINYHKEFSNFSLTWLYQWQFYFQLNDVSVFHVQYGTNSKPLDKLKKSGKFNPSIVVTFHGHDAFFPINGVIFNEGYYDDLFKHADLITTNTPYLATKIKKIGCPKELLAIIPVAVDTNYFHPIPNNVAIKGTVKLITIGRLHKIKGHKYCIEVVKQLKEKGFDISLTIVGGGEQRDVLEKLIQKYKLNDEIFLTGEKCPSEVRQILWEHHVYILTAVALNNERRETQGLATLEAQACGLPAVVFDSGGVKYTVKNGFSGYICEEYDVDKIVNEIGIMIKNNKIKNMGRNAAIFVKEEFSKEIIDEKWEFIYKRLAN